MWRLQVVHPCTNERRGGSWKEDERSQGLRPRPHRRWRTCSCVWWESQIRGGTELWAHNGKSTGLPNSWRNTPACKTSFCLSVCLDIWPAIIYDQKLTTRQPRETGLSWCLRQLTSCHGKGISWSWNCENELHLRHLQDQRKVILAKWLLVTTHSRAALGSKVTKLRHHLPDWGGSLWGQLVILSLLV